MRLIVHVHVGSVYSAQYGLPHNACNVNFPTPESVLLVFTSICLSSLPPHTDPATHPQQDMKVLRVIRTNYSLLWQHLDASKVLPKLVDKFVISEAKKKEVESYQQNHGQNAVIIDALFFVECAPEGLLTTCDMLQTTPGKEHIAQHILQGTINLCLDSDCRVGAV